MIPAVAEQGLTIADIRNNPGLAKPARGYWHVPKIWDGGSCVIIGGGPSLYNFNWDAIKHRNIIGCNNAYTLGPWVDVCYWGDNIWYHKYGEQQAFKDYKGLKVTSMPNHTNVPDIYQVDRHLQGVFTEPGLIGWNESTGASAINLAMQFGCKEIILLGFDMKLGVRDGEIVNNWHPNHIHPPNEQDLVRFAEAFGFMAGILRVQHPGVSVVNAGPDSALKCFPHVGSLEK